MGHGAPVEVVGNLSGDPDLKWQTQGKEDIGQHQAAKGPLWPLSLIVHSSHDHLGTQPTGEGKR
jgi:hypothetical protein